MSMRDCIIIICKDNNDLFDNIVILVPFSLCFNYDDILDIFEYFLVFYLMEQFK
jgi:hypothetical protein